MYTFGPIFRAENSNTARHLCEFWMVEPEVSFASLEDATGLAERCIRHSVNHLLHSCMPELYFFTTVSKADPDLLPRMQSLAEPKVGLLLWEVGRS